MAQDATSHPHRFNTAGEAWKAAWIGLRWLCAIQLIRLILFVMPSDSHAVAGLCLTLFRIRALRR